jgi:hypothetical protein
MSIHGARYGRTFGAAWLLTVLVFLGLYCTESHAYAPTTDYRAHSVNGFTVLIHRDVLAHPLIARRVLDELARQSEAIGKAIPKGAFRWMQSVRIWVEWRARSDTAMVFHESREWLRTHDHNPEKAGSVEIGNARHFLEWSAVDQPWMLLHELAHAYHVRVLGVGFAPIRNAYENAKRAGLYTAVSYALETNPKPAYALRNEREYFAELSEAYFGENDFFPYIRDDLRQYDPLGYAVVESAWHLPVGSLVAR